MALVDMFLKIEGIDGESPDSELKDWIHVYGFRLSAVSPRDAFTSQAAGAVQMSHLTIRTKVDISTPKLFDKVAKNEKIPSAYLRCRKAGGKEQLTYFEVAIWEVLVVKVQTGILEAVQGDVVPQCEVELAYGKIKLSAWEQTSKGGGAGGVYFMFNLMSNS